MQGTDWLASGCCTANHSTTAVQDPVSNPNCFRMLKQDILAGFVKGRKLSGFVVCHNSMSRW